VVRARLQGCIGVVIARQNDELIHESRVIHVKRPHTELYDLVEVLETDTKNRKVEVGGVSLELQVGTLVLCVTLPDTESAVKNTTHTLEKNDPMLSETTMLYKGDMFQVGFERLESKS
jgi:hypothetical protein